jgi:hypothetical protein
MLSHALQKLTKMTARAQHAGQTEAALLASEIAHASSLLDQAELPGNQTDTRLLFNAADSYRRTKNLLSVVRLEAGQAAEFQEQIAELQARLLGKNA